LKCHNCDSDLFETKSDIGTDLYYCQNKFCDFFGKLVEI